MADSGHGGGDLAGDLLIQGDQLCGTLADVAGMGLRLGLPGCPLRSRSAGHAVGDRKIFTHLESCRARILYRVVRAGASGIQIRGPASPNPGCSL